MDRLRQEQFRRNAAADDAWALYASHRQRVTALLGDATKVSAERLCLLGPGNLNDIELASLLLKFREIILIDIDAKSLQRGVTRQGFRSDGRIRLLAPVDVTGAFTELSRLTPATAADSVLVDECLRLLDRIPEIGELPSCDVVASVGLLTQLIDAVVRSVGETHARFWNLASAVRAQHLRLMLELTQPGGAAVLVTEVVSSDTCLALKSIDEADLPGLLHREISAGNFFTGMNPAALRHLLETDVRFVEQLEGVRFIQPWLWPFFARTYADYAVVLHKQSMSCE